MKVRSFFVVVLVFFGALLCAFGEAGDLERKWREALGADSFEKREEGMKALWVEGDKAVEILEKLQKDEDPEVAARAAMVLRKVKLGISPETSPKLVKLIERYWSGSPTMRLKVLAELGRAAEFDFMLRLRGMEKDPMVLQAVDEMIAKEMPKVIKKYLNDGKVEKARSMLAMSDKFEDMIRLGHLFELEGQLDGEIARLRNPASEKEAQRYLAYLRVKGDTGLLRKEASRLGDRDAELIAALVEGDFLAYFNDVLKQEQVPEVSKNYVRMVLAEYAGDRAAREKAIGAVVKVAEEGSQQVAGQVALFRMGYGERVIKKLPSDEFMTILAHYESQEDFLKVEEMLGLAGAGGFDEWLDKLAEEAENDLRRGRQGLAFHKLEKATSFLELRGRSEEAEKVCRALLDLSRDKKGSDREKWLSDLFNVAPKAVLAGMAREIDEFEQVVSVAFQELLGGSNYNVWLYHLLGKEDPKLTTKERLLLTFSFSNRYPLLKAEKFDEYFERIFTRILISEDREEELAKLHYLLRWRNRGEEMRRALEALVADGEDEGLRLGELALDSGKLSDAAKFFQNYEVDFREESVDRIFQIGLVLQKAGLKGGTEYVEKGKLLSDGSPASLVSMSDHYLQLGDMEKAQELLEDALLRSPKMPFPGSYTSAMYMVGELATMTLNKGEYQKARGFREVNALMMSYRDGLKFGHIYARNRFQALVARGAAAMEEGDVEAAVWSFGEAHRILPHDGYLANELFPVMRDVGLSEYHDHLFAVSARHARAMIKRYPNEDNGYNNFAWMASRANRCLDEAEGYLKTALKLNPQSAAYLDTMGEIYFARGNRKEATRWSRRSIANATLGEAMNWELHQQNRRFAEGEFPPK